MKKAIIKVLESMQEMKYIVINKDVNIDALAATILEGTFRSMTVKDFIESFYPKLN